MSRSGSPTHNSSSSGNCWFTAKRSAGCASCSPGGDGTVATIPTLSTASLAPHRRAETTGCHGTGETSTDNPWRMANTSCTSRLHANTEIRSICACRSSGLIAAPSKPQPKVNLNWERWRFAPANPRTDVPGCEREAQRTETPERSRRRGARIENPEHRRNDLPEPSGRTSRDALESPGASRTIPGYICK